MATPNDTPNSTTSANLKTPAPGAATAAPIGVRLLRFGLHPTLDRQVRERLLIGDLRHAGYTVTHTTEWARLVVKVTP